MENRKESTMEPELASTKAKEIHDHVPPDYYDQVRIQDNFVQYYWHKKRFETITAMIEKSSRRILDIGCNGGTFSKIIKDAAGKANLIGIDINKQSVKYAVYKNNGITFLVADGQKLPFKNNSFDLVTCLEMLEHVPSPELVINEVNRCLDKDGQIILLVPNSVNFLFRIIWYAWTNLGKGRIWNEAHLNDFDEEQLLTIILKFGFELIKKKNILHGMLIAIKARKSHVSNSTLK